MKSFDTAAAEIRQCLPTGLRLVILGSTSFWGSDSAEICRSLGVAMARMASLVAVTGGMNGVQAEFSLAYAAVCGGQQSAERLFHLLPLGMEAVKAGRTVTAGADFFERREILGRVGDVCLVIEGGPGTEHESRVAMSCGIPVIPVGRTGGHARKLYSGLPCPAAVSTATWALLNDRGATHDEVTVAVQNLVEQLSQRA
jgi:hypothetical protein